ncbi:16S rRNA (cytosine(1402)-N(4))-methyltransferase RsmH [Brachybacterium hainanense]|uniref:Ribosomal RNA small subunit methyltransferase H n=1 Tax=Brachybacterium hainanense TaxID=1541174 RepID=A0ABV6RES4_9MICO
MDTTNAPADDRHLPVLLGTCVDLLVPSLQHDGSVYVDGTLGMAGHAVAVLDAAPRAHLVGIDRDAEALELARERLMRAGHGDRITLVHATYDQIPAVLADLGIPAADAVMMDLGLSSFQIDTRERGFAYAQDAPLDMRMDAGSDGPTAADLLRDLSEQDLARMLKELGDERFARRIAQRIVAQRQISPITRSGELVALLEAAIPAATRASGGHPAKRTFQALRIAVNEELEILTRALEGALTSLALEGRLVVESYHSGEDRLVKAALSRGTRSSAPADLPVELEEHRPRFENLVRGALRADDEEIARNARSASVRLRAVRRVRPDI